MTDESNDPSWLSWLSMLSDLARVRLLRLLAREELGVGEMSRILQMPQSTVSRHLKPLYVAGWVTKRAEGTASLYRLSPETMPDAALELWALTRDRAGHGRAFADDDHRLATLVAERPGDSKAFFGRIGGEWDRLRRELFGEAFSSEALLALLDPTWVVADLGCGTGHAAERLADVVERVVAVDREASMLDAARARLGDRGIEFRQGELESLPIADGELDAAVVFLVMHYVEEPAAVTSEIARCLRPGGVLLVVDMVAHERETFRHTMGHLHMGFSESQVRAWAAGADGADQRLKAERHLRLRPDTEAKGPGLFAATFRRQP